MCQAWGESTTSPAGSGQTQPGPEQTEQDGKEECSGEKGCPSQDPWYRTQGSSGLGTAAPSLLSGTLSQDMPPKGCGRAAMVSYQGTDPERGVGPERQGAESCRVTAPTASPACAEEGLEQTPRAGEASAGISQPCQELGWRLHRRLSAVGP